MQKKEFYSPKDSHILGLVGVAVPVVASIIIAIVMIFVAFGAGSGYEQLFDSPAFIYTTQILCEGAFIIALVVYNKIGNISYKRASLLTTKPKYLNWAIAIIVGIALPIFFSPIISVWEQLLNLIGIKLVALNIPFSTGLDLVLAVLIVAIIPAFCEELFFRGAVLNGLRSKGLWYAVLYSSMCFALMHGNLQQLPYTFLLGVVVGYIVFYTRSIWLGVLAHALNNATVLLVSYFFASSSTPDFTWAMALYIALMTLVGVGLLVFMFWAVRRYNKPTTLETPAKATMPPQPENKKDGLTTGLIISTVLLSVILMIFRAFNG